MKTRPLVATILGAGLALAACSPNPDAQPTPTTSPSAPAEAAGPQPRLVTTYDGGILTLDAESLEVLDDTKLPGFNRLNALGDNRNLLVSTQDGFQVLDTGAWTEPHGDHTHSYTTSPELKDHTYQAKKPGHVVVHDGRTLLFSDGDGRIQDLSLSDVARANKRNSYAKPEKVTEVEPHHGVGVALPDGGMLHTEGTEDERHSIVAVDKDNRETARTDACPGVHGEAAAQGGAITFGCEDGIVIYRDGAFHKISSPDSYGRIGNQFGSPHSPVVLGDYKTDEHAELERPTRISLTDTSTQQIKLVDLPASYSFRSLTRGPEGKALVLGTDGHLRAIDPTSGDITADIPVISEWKEPMEWQKPRPTLFVLGDTAYVTSPKTKEIHAVDLASGKVDRTAELPETPNELNGVSG